MEEKASDNFYSGQKRVFSNYIFLNMNLHTYDIRQTPYAQFNQIIIIYISSPHCVHWLSHSGFRHKKKKTRREVENKHFGERGAVVEIRKKDVLFNPCKERKQR